jgi:hypothetical protein
VKTYNQISIGLLEMSSGPKSMKSNRKTRRSSRQIVLDELELVMRRLEQIKNMVDKHCVAPLKEPSVRSQIVAHLQSKAQAQTKSEPEEAVIPLTPVQEEDAAVQQAEAEEAASEPSKLALAVEPAAPKRRKSGGCPGGPKAYNEFVKKWLAEQRASGREMTYQEALKEIKQNNIYTQSCGLPPKKNKTRKLNKVLQTPGRVNAPYVPYVQNSPNAPVSPPSLAPAPAASLAPASVKERGKSLPPTAANLEKQESERKYLEEGIASRRAAREAEAGLPPIKEEATPSPTAAEAEAEAEAVSLASPAAAPAPTPSVSQGKGYEDLGMNDNLGMRKISVNGRQLLMTNGNSGLFEDKNGAPGDFVGYLKNGKVEASSPPEL